MSRVNWSSEDSEILIKSLSSPYDTSQCKTKRSVISSKRENDPDLFINRIRGQIIEIKTKHLGYKTPEDWDKSFDILGGGSSRRRSKSILSRMTWSRFLEEFDKIDLP